MLSSIRHTLDRLKRNTSGNAMLLVGIGMPILIGSSGLAVDTAQYYTWKRDLQLAADQAALAGAWARSDVTTEASYQTRALQEYNANLQITTNFDAAPVTTLVNYGAGTNNAVKVVASATKSLPFSYFLSGRSITVAVEARASVVAAVAGTSTTIPALTACMIALDPSAQGAFTIGGTASGSVGCGGATLSNDANAAIEELGNPGAQFGSLTAAGGIEASLLNNVGNDPTKLHANQTGLIDPYGTLTEPTGSGVAQTYSCPTGGGAAQPYPGSYTNIAIGCTTNFRPGIYVISGSIDFSNNRTVTGTDVLFVMKNANNIANINSNENIALSGITSSTLQTTYGYSSSGANKLAGMLFWDTKSTGQIKFNGNSSSYLNGIMYMPSRQLWFNGNSNVSGNCMMIVAGTIIMNGTTNLSSFCNVNGSTVPSVRPEITTTTAGTSASVKLVV